MPSRINGNIGHKYKSQATHLGQNLSHINAYNGEKRYMWKNNTCVGHKAQKYSYIKLLYKNLPGIMSAVSATRLSNQDTGLAL